MILIYRMLTIFLPNFRYVLLHARTRMTRGYKLRAVLDNTEIGDWWLMYLLSKNIDPLNYRNIMDELYESFTKGDNADEQKQLLGEDKK